MNWFKDIIDDFYIVHKYDEIINETLNLLKNELLIETINIILANLSKNYIFLPLFFKWQVISNLFYEKSNLLKKIRKYKMFTEKNFACWRK